MKVFAFDPATGKRGHILHITGRASWTGQSVRYQVEHGIIEPIEAKIPATTRSQEWTLHVDAGRTDHQGVDQSYLCDEWVCFCLGEAAVGQGPGQWVWVVLPPKDLIKPADPTGRKKSA